MISRRKFIERAGKVVLVHQLMPNWAWGQSSGSSLASQIRKKYSGKSIRLLYPKGSLPNIAPIVKVFKQETGVKVQAVEASLDEISAEIIIDGQVKKNATVDVAIPPTFAIPNLVAAGAIQDLSALAKQFEPKTFRDGHLYTLGDFYKNRFYGYQTDGDAYLMFYNKAWLTDPAQRKRYKETYGVTLQVAKTWEELDRQIRFFHNPQKDRFGGNLFRNKNYASWEYWSRLHGKKLYPVDANFEPQFTRPDAVQALKELVATSEFLDPRSSDHGLFDNFAAFAEGKSFCNIGWGGTQKHLMGPTSKMKDNLVFGLLPGGRSGGKAFGAPYFNWGWNYVVLANSKKSELAYLFTLFASSVESTIASVREPKGYFDPFMNQHYENPEIRSTYGDDFLKVHKQSLIESVPDFYVQGQGEYFAALKQGVHAANLKHLPPAKALKLVSEKWNRITEKIGRASQVEQWKFLKGSYPKNLKGILK